MVDKPIESGSVPFRAESRLLQELGERLVASSDVALVELIKNSYDADAIQCDVSVAADTDALVVSDTGNGMTLDDFLNRWMTIATDSKRASRVSPKFGRSLTGSKGIGRFAVRFLGDSLDLQTIAYDSQRQCTTRLHAIFDWQDIDKAADLSATRIRYSLYKADSSSSTGTTLTINSLRGGTSVVFSKTVRTQILRLISPLSGLERGHLGGDVSTTIDPGFTVNLPDRSGDNEERTLASIVLDQYWARLLIKLERRKLRFEVYFKGDSKPRYTHPSERGHQPFSTHLSKGLFADIRFFPRRSGIFSGKDFDGRTAWSWVRDNSGVSVVDHGFRVKPYGFGDDDWLLLDSDNARNYRKWRSDLMEEYYSIPEEHRKAPSLNPMFNLPQSMQLVGAVSVESNQSAEAGDDLIPSMDREGFIQNIAFKEMWEVVRAGIEFLALADEKEEQKKLAEEAKQAQADVRADFKAAIAYIRNSPTLSEADKNRITAEYATLVRHVDEVDAYNRRARESLETMGLLGVIAGFMTHESRRILWNLEAIVKTLEVTARKVPEVAAQLAAVKDALSAFKGHVEYTSTFIGAVHDTKAVSFASSAQVRRIIRLFKGFVEDRGIDVKNEIPPGTMTPPIPVAVYSGVILNLYTNAIKAVLAAPSKHKSPTVVFRGWNEPNRHIIEVLDNGIGVPPNLRERIFDPLFTTTSTINNPLGSGMGLGLSLVRKLMRELGGSITLIDPPSDFSTCFKLELPMVRK
jgi:signal transduction histidine kinase